MSTVTRLLGGSERPWDPANRLGLLFLCIVLIVALSVVYPRFPTVSNAFTILLNITAIGIAAFGSALLIIGGNVDLSIGGILAIVSITTASVVRDTQDPLIGLVVAIAMGGTLGLPQRPAGPGAQDQPADRDARHGHDLPRVRRSSSAMPGRSTTSRTPSSRSGGWTSARCRCPWSSAASCSWSAATCCCARWSGLRIYALGGSVSSARLAGIRTERLTVMLFMVNGALVGLVAVLTTARLGSAQPQVGTNFELDVLTAVILGGVAFNGGSGHPLGVLIGVVTIGVLDAGIIFVGVPDFWQQIARGGVLLLALAIDQLAAYRREHATRPASSADAATVEARSLERPPDRSGSGRHDGGQPVIVARDLKKSYGTVAAVRGVSFRRPQGRDRVPRRRQRRRQELRDQDAQRRRRAG